MVEVTSEIKQCLTEHKERLLNQPYTDRSSRTVELIDILLGIQDGR